MFEDRECLLISIHFNLFRNECLIFFRQLQFYCVTIASFASNNKFKCKKCGRMYQTKNSLKSNVEVICRKLLQFKCDFCNQRTFKQIGNYKLHLLRVYNIMKFKKL